VTGRESPAVSLAIEGAIGKDYFGRDVSSAQSRVTNALSNMTPIFVQQVIEGIEEGAPIEELVTRGAIGFTGMNVWPRSPYRGYDDAYAAFRAENNLEDNDNNQRLFDRTEPGKRWQGEIERYGSQWKEDTITRIYNSAQALRSWWESGEMGKQSLKGLAAKALSGEESYSLFRQALQDYGREASTEFTDAQNYAGITDEEMGGTHKQALLDFITDGYFAITLDQFNPDGDEISAAEAATWRATREAFILSQKAAHPELADQIEPYIRTGLVSRWSDPQLKEMQKKFLVAQDDLEAYFQIPRWANYDVAQGEKIDRFRDLGWSVRQMLRDAFASQGDLASADAVDAKYAWDYILSPATMPPEVKDAIRSQEDANLLAFAAELETSQQARDYYTDPRRKEFLLNHQDLIRFYPNEFVGILSELERTALAPDLRANLSRWQESYDEMFPQ